MIIVIILTFLLTILTGNKILLAFSCLFGLIIFVNIYGYLKSDQKEDLKRKNRTIHSNIAKIPNFNPTSTVKGTNYIVSIDEQSEQVAFANTLNTYVFKFEDIIESEIIQDDVSIIKASRTSQIGGALVGAALSGGVGAVIGGLSGSKQSTTKVKKITVRVTINDLKMPLIKADFFNHPSGLPKTEPSLSSASNRAERCHSMMNVIINRNSKVVV
jgi:hypothetical protein